MQNLKMMVMAAGLFPVVALANNTTPVNLRGTLIEPPPCTINGGATIVIDFGDNVGISRIDGINYARTVDYHIRCENDSDNNLWVMGLTVIGTATSFDEAAIQTTIDGSSSKDLGIKLNLDGRGFILNQRVEIKGTLPVFGVVPVKPPGAALPEGKFHATATLLADYE